MEEQINLPDVRATVARKWATARAVPLNDLWLVGFSWWMIATASLVIALVPTRHILRMLGPNLGAVTQVPPTAPRERTRALQIARAIGIAARNAPFRADCYPQALAAAQLCRWFAVPHAVQLGARFAESGGQRSGRLEGHAWVCSGSLTICGGSESARRFGTVACFVHLPGKIGADAV